MRTIFLGAPDVHRSPFDVDNEAQRGALRTLGIDAANFMGLDADQAFMKLAAGYKTAQQTGQGFSEVFELLKKTAPELIPALAENDTKLKDLAAQFVATGGWILG